MEQDKVVYKTQNKTKQNKTKQNTGGERKLDMRNIGSIGDVKEVQKNRMNKFDENKPSTYL